MIHYRHEENCQRTKFINRREKKTQKREIRQKIQYTRLDSSNMRKSYQEITQKIGQINIEIYT